MRVLMRILALAVLVVATWAMGALAQTRELLTGTPHVGVFHSRDRAVPLPPGEWVEFSRHAWLGNSRGPGFSYEDVGLARLTPQGVDAVIHLRTINHEGGTSNVRTWASDPACRRNDTFFSDAGSRDERDQTCLPLNHVIRAPNRNGSPVWADYAALREGRDALFPTTLIGTTLRFARGRAATTLTCYFGVEAHGFPIERTSWAESPWHRSRADAPRLALMEQYKGWMTSNADAVRRALEQGQAAWLSPTP